MKHCFWKCTLMTIAELFSVNPSVGTQLLGNIILGFFIQSKILFAEEH